MLHTPHMLQPHTMLPCCTGVYITLSKLGLPYCRSNSTSSTYRPPLRESSCMTRDNICILFNPGLNGIVGKALCIQYWRLPPQSIAQIWNMKNMNNDLQVICLVQNRTWLMNSLSSRGISPITFWKQLGSAPRWYEPQSFSGFQKFSAQFLLFASHVYPVSNGVIIRTSGGRNQRPRLQSICWLV